MADTDDTLGELDRMLFLRRVPLFSQLGPEDDVSSAGQGRVGPGDLDVADEGPSSDR